MRRPTARHLPVAILMVGLVTGCGAGDVDAPPVSRATTCRSLDEDFEPLVTLVEQGKLAHIAGIIETRLDPSTRRAVLMLLFDVLDAFPPGAFGKLGPLVANPALPTLTPIIVKLLEPLPGDPGATPPKPPRTDVLAAASRVASVCLDTSLYELATGLLQDPRTAKALVVLHGTDLGGQGLLAKLRAALDDKDREAVIALLADVITSIANWGIDPAHIRALVEALLPAETPGMAELLGVIDVVFATPERSVAAQKFALCLRQVDESAVLAGYVYDLLMAPPATQPPASPSGQSFEEDAAFVLVEISHVTELLWKSEPSRDALSQVLALLLRPDLGVDAVPDLIALLQSGFIEGFVRLMSDLATQPCREQAFAMMGGA